MTFHKYKVFKKCNLFTIKTILIIIIPSSLTNILYNYIVKITLLFDDNASSMEKTFESRFL